MSGLSTTRKNLDANGFAVEHDAVGQAILDALSEQVDQAQSGRNAKKQNLRNAFEVLPAARQLVTHPTLARLVTDTLGPDAFAVRAIVFDKTPGANWRVAWHQDTAIPLREPGDAPGFGPPSTKDGVAHTRAPAELLARMLTVRLHLDDCFADNGPLRVVTGSHRLGRLDDDAIADHVRTHPSVAVTVPAGGLLVMRPLLLHASSPATSPSHRRVLHLEFATGALPAPLAWHIQYPVNPHTATRV
ncbi:MAG: phytanoyl-CoA dioxygenase family protein [Planctomycetota bacterium]